VFSATEEGVAGAARCSAMGQAQSGPGGAPGGPPKDDPTKGKKKFEPPTGPVRAGRKRKKTGSDTATKMPVGACAAAVLLSHHVAPSPRLDLPRPFAAAGCCCCCCFCCCSPCRLPGDPLPRAPQ